MGGEAVKAIQHALKARGFDPSGIDGDFGEATAQAVQAFQEAQGLVPDGEVEPETAKRRLEIVLGHGGGFSDHPRDNGGATRFGITRATLQDWRGKAVTEAEVAPARLGPRPLAA